MELSSLLIPIKIIKLCKPLCPSKVLHAVILPESLAANTNSPARSRGRGTHAVTEIPFCSRCRWRSALRLRTRMPAPWHGHPMLKEEQFRLPSSCSVLWPTSIMLIQIQTDSRSAVVCNSHFSLVKIELGLSFLPSLGRWRKEVLRHQTKAHCSHLFWQVADKLWQILACISAAFFRFPVCPKQRSSVPQSEAEGVCRAAPNASVTRMPSQEKKWHRR